MGEPFYDGALHMMEKQGGSFVRSLVDCYYHADPQNKRILREAFAKYFDEYEDRFARYRSERHQPLQPEKAAMPDEVSRSNPGPGLEDTYVPDWCFEGGARVCTCGHHEGYHINVGRCLLRHQCGCAGWKNREPHGWVNPSPDKPKARCGGPPLCQQCKREQDYAEYCAAASVADSRGEQS